MYRAKIDYCGELSYVFDEDAADEMLDFQESAAEYITNMIDALENLRELICSFPLPNMEPIPINPEPTDPDYKESEGELPF